MNLTLQFPKSPKEKVAGLVHVARMADKARASQNDTLGEYIYPCPLDKMLLEFLEITDKEFLQKANQHSLAEIEQWVAKLCESRTVESIAKFNREFLGQQPDNDESWKKFRETRDKLAPSRTDIRTWVDLIDLEEGRS